MGVSEYYDSDWGLVTDETLHMVTSEHHKMDLKTQPEVHVSPSNFRLKKTPTKPIPLLRMQLDVFFICWLFNE